MADQHRATAEHWDLIGRMCHRAEFSCLVELRDRVEALEAAQPAQPNYPEKPDSSLVERVKSRMIESVGYSVTWEEATSSVLIEVAAWLRDHYGGTTATTDLLEQEAER